MCALLLGCAGSQKGAGSSGPPPNTSGMSGPLQVVGPRCAGGVCACRRVDDYGKPLEPERDEETSATGMKRYEIRTGRGLDPISISVAGRGTLEKNIVGPEPSCGYIDLPPGKHVIRVRAKPTNPEAGMQPAFWVSEHSATQKSWYDTFHFRCSENGPCTEGHMEAWLSSMRKNPRGIFDPCGSTRVEGAKWGGQKHGMLPQLVELEMEITLNVYKFEPRFKAGAVRCKGESEQAAE